MAVGSASVTKPAPRDNLAYRFPVSIKGVVLLPAGVCLLRNERDEWELPGGKLEPGEDPADCLVREVREELGIVVTAGPLLDCWVYCLAAGVEVLIVTFGCHVEPGPQPTVSSEHKALGLFPVDQIATLPIPEGYRRSIRSWAGLARSNPA
jgi:8-oxo-dGTP pyrophosphatase MutT (NUDIX family)